MKVLYFDVIGTLVDWKSSIKNQLPDFVDGKEIAFDWARFYSQGNFKYETDLINKGEDIISKYDLYDHVDKDIFVNTWTNLKPWPDTINSMNILREKYLLVALTNVTTETVVKLSKNIGLPFDYIFSSELTGKKKPDPAVYLQACHVMQVDPGEAMLVAAHRFDLEAARGQGMHTCYVERNDDCDKDELNYDYVVNSLEELVNAII